jgi:hypothetical protein
MAVSIINYNSPHAALLYGGGTLEFIAAHKYSLHEQNIHFKGCVCKVYYIRNLFYSSARAQLVIIIAM